MHGNTMRCKADVAPYMAMYGNPTGLPLTNTTYPAIRDAIRFEQRYWIPLMLGAHGEQPRTLNRIVDRERLKGNHCAHTKPDDPLRVAYFRDERHRYADRVTVARPGGYLTANYSRVLDATTIKNMAESMRIANTDPADFLFFAETEEEITQIYTESGGMNAGSCMRYNASNWNLVRDGEYVHPAAVYAGPDTRVAYLKIGNTYKARTVVADRGYFEDNKQWIRIYGDAGLMQRALESKGYRAGSLEGVRYSPIQCDNGNLGAPYFDSNATRSTKHGEYFVLGSSGHINCPQHSVCVLQVNDSQRCGCCNETYDEDDMYHSDYHGNWVCEGCRDSYYVRTYNDDLVHDDDVILCQSNQEYYLDNTATLRDYDIVWCADTDDYWFRTDCAIHLDIYGGKSWLSAPLDTDYVNIHGTILWVDYDLDELRRNTMLCSVRQELGMEASAVVYIADEDGNPTPYLTQNHEATEAA